MSGSQLGETTQQREGVVRLILTALAAGTFLLTAIRFYWDAKERREQRHRGKHRK